MKIGILNECFLNEKHLKRLKTLGEVVIFENTTTEQEAIERLKGLPLVENTVDWADLFQVFER